MDKRTYSHNGVTILEMPTEMLKIVWLDREKREGAIVTEHGNFCNANFFGTYDEGSVNFTLPAGHLKCDVLPGYPLHGPEDKYMHERGKVENGKFTFDSGKWSYMNPTSGNAVSTLFIRDGKAFVADAVTLDAYQNCDYIISGVPCLRNGDDVSFYGYVQPQGWGVDTVRATHHVFVGVKDDPTKIYVMWYQSTTKNLIYGMEFYNKIKDAGFRDILKLDGGGSFIFKCPDIPEISKMTSTVRCINAVLTFDELPEPEPEPALDPTELLASVAQLQSALTDMAQTLASAQIELSTLKKKIDGSQ